MNKSEDNVVPRILTVPTALEARRLARRADPTIAAIQELDARLGFQPRYKNASTLSKSMSVTRITPQAISAAQARPTRTQMVTE
jgi:hypothetical protein